MKKPLMLLLAVLALAGCSGQLRESSFIAQGQASTGYSPAELTVWQRDYPAHQLRAIEMATDDGKAVLRGVYLDHPQSRETILLFPGNGMTVAKGGREMLKTLAPLGRDLVIFDRRGLGASTGQASIANLGEDGLTKLRYVRGELAAQSVVVHGFSLGSFIAAHVAKTAAVDALVLQGSATNVDDWIDYRTPWYAAPFLTIDVAPAFRQVDNRQVVAEHYRGPLLVIAGDEDQQVPPALSQALFDASQSANKQLMMVTGAGHGTMLDQPEQVSRYLAFLDSR